MIRSNHAMRLMMICALTRGRVAPVAEVARACNMSEAHLGKIAQALASNGFVETVRGRHGGVRLARPPAELIVGEIMRATEFGRRLVEMCRFRSIIGRALETFLRVLAGDTLADLVAKPEGVSPAKGLPTPRPSARPDPRGGITRGRGPADRPGGRSAEKDTLRAPARRGGVNLSERAVRQRLAAR